MACDDGILQFSKFEPMILFLDFDENVNDFPQY